MEAAQATDFLGIQKQVSVEISPDQVQKNFSLHVASLDSKHTVGAPEPQQLADLLCNQNALKTNSSVELSENVMLAENKTAAMPIQEEKQRNSALGKRVSIPSLKQRAVISSTSSTPVTTAAIKHVSPERLGTEMLLNNKSTKARSQHATPAVPTADSKKVMNTVALVTPEGDDSVCSGIDTDANNIHPTSMSPQKCKMETKNNSPIVASAVCTDQNMIGDIKTNIETKNSDNNNKECLPLQTLPIVPATCLSREFNIDGLNGVEITSLDITAHGCYVLAGCGNGMVLLFDLTQTHTEPALVGHIMAKGLHTNLLMTVRITEDCRFCFAGVAKGSSELLAIDLGKLPVWSEARAYGFKPIRRQNGFVTDRVTCLSRSDPKLRGFGAAVRVQGNYSRDTYRLASGLGIKNVHVWQFVPGVSPGEESTWTCMYDVASNGNTIESIGFRNGGQELLSKSVGVNLRVWDLSEFDKNPEGKPAFEDVANSADVRALRDGFAFGGIYEFAVVRLAAPKVANRDVLEVPERNKQAVGTEGDRRRRMMRQIDSVIGTNDAKHSMVLCADGGVLYYQRPMEDFARGKLIELPQLERDPVTLIQSGARDWTLSRVGAHGEVVLLRATQTSPVRILVSPLSTIAADAMQADSNSSAQHTWNTWGYYSAFDDKEDLITMEVKTLSPPPKATKHAQATSNSSSKENVNTIKGGNTAIKDKTVTTAMSRGSSGRPPLAPLTSSASANNAQNKRPRPKSEENVSRGRPSNASLGMSANMNATTGSHKRPIANNLHLNGIINTNHRDKDTVNGFNSEDQISHVKNPYQRPFAPGDQYAKPFVFEELPPKTYPPLALHVPKRVRRVIEAPFNTTQFLNEAREKSALITPEDVQRTQPMEEELPSHIRKSKSAANMVMDRFKSLCTHFIADTMKESSSLTSGQMSSSYSSTAALTMNSDIIPLQPRGICTLKQMGEQHAEQTRLRANFVAEVTRTVGRHLMVLNSLELPEGSFINTEQNVHIPSNTQPMPLTLPCADAMQEVEFLIFKYQSIVQELLQRHAVEYAAAQSADLLLTYDSSNTNCLTSDPLEKQKTCQFVYKNIWSQARNFVHTVQLLVHAALQAQPKMNPLD